MSKRPPTILFDLTNLIWRARSSTPTGIQRVELAYARYLLDNHRAHTHFVISFPPAPLIIPLPQAARFIAATESAWATCRGTAHSSANDRLNRFIGDEVCATWNPPAATKQNPPGVSRFMLSTRILSRAILQNFRPYNLATLIKSDRPITYLCVSGSALPGPWICRSLRSNPRIAGVFMLHDLIPVTHPEYVRPVMAARHRKYVEQLAGCASTIVSNSQFTADCLARFTKTAGIRLPQSVVAPLGIGEVFSPARGKAGMPPYFVFVGTIEPRKNHILLLQMWQRLVQQHGDSAPKLVLVGKRGWENENILDLLDRGEHLRSHVLECNNLGDSTMVQLIANARALVLPSHVEGYGLPVAEALALGTPVICSDLPPLREIAGDIPEYVDPLAGRGWARTIMDYTDPDHPRRHAQLQKLARFSVPTWSEHFAKIESALGLHVLDADSEIQTQPARPEFRGRRVGGPVVAHAETASDRA